jgi:ANTAR domain-containing protein
VKLFETMGAWLDDEQVDSLLLHFDERQYTLLRPSKERLRDSNGFLLERVAQLETALQSRIVIEQAKGVLAHALGISTDEAFNVLRKAARDRGTNLRDLAAKIAASPGQGQAILGDTSDRTR